MAVLLGKYRISRSRECGWSVSWPGRVRRPGRLLEGVEGVAEEGGGVGLVPREAQFDVPARVGQVSGFEQVIPEAQTDTEIDTITPGGDGFRMVPYMQLGVVEDVLEGAQWDF